MQTEFKEVKKDEFYNTIGPLDVVLSITTDFPYTTEFKLRSGTVKGKCVNSWTDGVYQKRPIIEKYYLTN
jgi:hypothetical protein